MRAVVNASATACKICGADALLYGVVDFAKSCHDHTGTRLPLSGIPVYYRRCRQCRFVFSDQFASWSDDDFRQHVYLEHSSRPHDTVADLASFLAEEAVVVFSTLVQPEDFDTLGQDWWYVGPRNGHISIFSREALRLLFLRNGLQVVSL